MKEKAQCVSWLHEKRSATTIQRNCRKEYRRNSRLLNVSKTGLTNLKRLVALVVVKKQASQFQAIALPTLCLRYFYGNQGNQLTELLHMC